MPAPHSLHRCLHLSFLLSWLPCCTVTCEKPCSNTAKNYTLCCDGIYLPSFTFTNAARFQEDRLEPYTIKFSGRGSMLWETRVHGVFYQPMSFKHYPFDSFELFVDLKFIDMATFRPGGKVVKLQGSSSGKKVRVRCYSCIPHTLF